MSLMGAVLVIVFILFVREEILSAGCRKEIERVQLAYEYSVKSALEQEYAALPSGSEGAVAELPPFNCCEEQQKSFFDAA